MKTSSYCSIILIVGVIFIKLCFGYEIPNVKVTLLNNQFTLSLAGEPGLKKVLYVVKINDKCPGYMDLLIEPQTDWITTQSVNLKPKDKLNVSILVDHDGDAYRSSQYIIVGENNNIGTPIQIPKQSPQTKCSQKPIPTFSGNCEPATTIVRGNPNICKDQLIFEENFDGSEIDMQSWSFDVRNLLIGKESEEFVVFDSNSDNIFLSGGYLNIKPTFTLADKKTASLDFGSRCTPVSNLINECKLMPQPPFVYVPPINSSQIHTRNKFEFKYGRVEIKAKLPKGDWLLPYIMLENFGTFDKKQIRIAFARGNEQLMTSNNMEDIGGRRLYGGVVKDVDDHDVDFKDTYSSEHYGNDFHIYTMTWTKDSISMAVDGVAYGAVRDNLNEFHEEFFISLGVSAGGHFEFPDNLLNPEEKPWRNTSPKAIGALWQRINGGQIAWTHDNHTMRIDYVRVYAL